jgi:thiamine pyrophosphokinase
LHALIVGNGSVPGQSLFEKEFEKCDYLIAADGGASACFLYNRIPDVVIGDLDSYSARPDMDVKVILENSQETNDLEKAIQHAIDCDAKHIVVLGATGERLDQTLKNISVMVQFTDEISDLVLKDDLCWMRILPESYSFKTLPGTLISLFPVSGIVEGITTRGLKYSLHDESLQNGVRDGSSNEATEETVEISHKKGDLLLMVFDSKESD